MDHYLRLKADGDILQIHNYLWNHIEVMFMMSLEERATYCSPWCQYNCNTVNESNFHWAMESLAEAEHDGLMTRTFIEIGNLAFFLLYCDISPETKKRIEKLFETCEPDF